MDSQEATQVGVNMLGTYIDEPAWACSIITVIILDVRLDAYIMMRFSKACITICEYLIQYVKLNLYIFCTCLIRQNVTIHFGKMLGF